MVKIILYHFQISSTISRAVLILFTSFLILIRCYQIGQNQPIADWNASCKLVFFCFFFFVNSLFGSPVMWTWGMKLRGFVWPCRLRVIITSTYLSCQSINERNYLLSLYCLLDFHFHYIWKYIITTWCKSRILLLPYDVNPEFYYYHMM